MGKAKGKSIGRGGDDDDFECAVQALEIDTPATQPQQADDESSELDELLERALALGLLSESGFDELTDALAEGTRSEAEVRDEVRGRLQQWELEQNEQGGATPAAATPAPAASSAVPSRNALRVLGSLDELEALTAAAGTDGLVVVQYTAKWCGQCRKIGPFVSAALPAEFGHVRFASHLPPTTYHLPPTSYHLPLTSTHLLTLASYHSPPNTHLLTLTSQHSPPNTHLLTLTSEHSPPNTTQVRFASVDVDACAEAAERAGAEKLPLFELLIGG